MARGRHAAPRKPKVRPAAYVTTAVTVGATAVATTDLAGANMTAAPSAVVSLAGPSQSAFASGPQAVPADVQAAIEQRSQASASRSSQRVALAAKAAAQRTKANAAAALVRLNSSVDAKGYSEPKAQAPNADATAAATTTERTSRSSTRPAAPAPTFTGSPQAIAQAMLSSYGWGQGQWSCLNSLWTKESSWQIGATNPSSGAYGIPQSLPGNKMASAGADWRTNPATQIRWGLGYIQGRYGSPCGAWAHSVATNWY